MAYYLFWLWSWIMPQFISLCLGQIWDKVPQSNQRIGDRVDCLTINNLCFERAKENTFVGFEIRALLQSSCGLERFRCRFSLSLPPFLPQSGAPSIMAWLEPNEGGLQLLLLLLPLPLRIIDICWNLPLSLLHIIIIICSLITRRSGLASWVRRSTKWFVSGCVKFAAP